MNIQHPPLGASPNPYRKCLVLTDSLLSLGKSVQEIAVYAARGTTSLASAGSPTRGTTASIIKLIKGVEDGFSLVLEGSSVAESGVRPTGSRILDPQLSLLQKGNILFLALVLAKPFAGPALAWLSLAELFSFWRQMVALHVKITSEFESKQLDFEYQDAHNVPHRKASVDASTGIDFPPTRSKMNQTHEFIRMKSGPCTGLPAPSSIRDPQLKQQLRRPLTMLSIGRRMDVFTHYHANPPHSLRLLPLLGASSSLRHAGSLLPGTVPQRIPSLRPQPESPSIDRTNHQMGFGKLMTYPKRAAHSQVLLGSEDEEDVVMSPQAAHRLAFILSAGVSTASRQPQQLIGEVVADQVLRRAESLGRLAVAATTRSSSSSPQYMAMPGGDSPPVMASGLQTPLSPSTLAVEGAWLDGSALLPHRPRLLTQSASPTRLSPLRHVQEASRVDRPALLPSHRPTLFTQSVLQTPLSPAAHAREAARVDRSASRPSHRSMMLTQSAPCVVASGGIFHGGIHHHHHYHHHHYHYNQESPSTSAAHTPVFYDSEDPLNSHRYDDISGREVSHSPE